MKDIGYELKCDSYYDKEANLILVFYFDKPIGQEVVLTVVRTINIKKFVEENFKDKENPQK